MSILEYTRTIEGVPHLYCQAVIDPSDEDFADPDHFLATYIERDVNGDLRRTWPQRSFSSWHREGYFTRFHNAIADDEWKRMNAAMIGQRAAVLALTMPGVPVFMRALLAFPVGYGVARLSGWTKGQTEEEQYYATRSTGSKLSLRKRSRSPRGCSRRKVLGVPLQSGEVSDECNRLPNKGGVAPVPTSLAGIFRAWRATQGSSSKHVLRSSGLSGALSRLVHVRS